MSNKKALPLICELAAALRDGPLTVVGAAEILGCSPITTDKYLRAFGDAKLAHVQAWRRKHPWLTHCGMGVLVRPRGQERAQAGAAGELEKQAPRSGGMNEADLYLKLTGFCKQCDETGCLEWVGGFGGARKETPVFHFPGTRLCRRSMPAYKAAWILSGNPLKDGQIVYRKCLNYKCVSPEHCAAGTTQQMWTHIAKSGKHKGKANRRIANIGNGAKQRTSVELVRRVEGLIAEKRKRTEIAALTGVNVSTVTDIRHGRHFHSASRQKLIRGASVFALA